MVITVDKLSDEALYQQIRRQVVAAIATGELRPGDALPSVRSLACDLGINLHTVNKAYATLRDEGYLLLLGRRGAFVADVPADPAAGMDERDLERGLLSLLTEYLASGGTREGFASMAAEVAAVPLRGMARERGATGSVASDALGPKASVLEDGPSKVSASGASASEGECSR